MAVSTPPLRLLKVILLVRPQLPEGQWAARATDANPGTRVVVHE